MVICIVCGGTPYPDHAWTDFVVIILGWWIGVWCRLLQGGTESAAFEFMDGPQFLTIVSTAADEYRIDAFDPSTDRSKTLLDGVDCATIGRSLLRAADHTIIEATRRGWPSADLTHLIKMHRQLAGLTKCDLQTDVGN